MTITTLEEFTAAELAKSPAEVLERFWAADTVVAEHSHPFDANALIIKGEMWLTCGGQTQHLRPGDRFSVPRGTPHAERYGPEGTTFWVARRGA